MANIYQKNKLIGLVSKKGFGVIEGLHITKTEAKRTRRINSKQICFLIMKSDEID